VPELGVAVGAHAAEHVGDRAYMGYLGLVRSTASQSERRGLTRN
jgi:hypothetical protein